MRILLDARPAMGGVHRSTMELARALESALPDGDLVAFGRRGTDSAPPPEPGPGRRAARLLGGSLKRILADQVILPAAARRGVDLLHSPSPFLPASLPVPAVVTVHDLTPFRRPGTKKRSPVTLYERWGARRALARARRLIVPSDAVAAQLTSEVGIAPERIARVYPLLPGLEALPEVPLPEAARRPFLLTVGTLEPRKNLERLVEAHSGVWEWARVPLLLVGAYGWRQRRLLRQIPASGGRVRWLGRVDDPTLAALYRHAAAVVQPSLEEGFDYPVAEALFFGAPLVLSDLPVHREVAGDCALYAPADRTDLLAERMLEALDWTPERRAAHAGRARKRAEALRAATSVEDTLRVYREALRAPEPTSGRRRT